MSDRPHLESAQHAPGVACKGGRDHAAPLLHVEGTPFTLLLVLLAWPALMLFDRMLSILLAYAI